MIHLKLKGVHLCCGGCVDAVVSAVERIPDAAAQCDMENGTVTVTARDDTAAQMALDAIAAAGLHGETGNERLKMRPQSGIPAGKVRKVKVSGIHNCCQPCYDALESAVRSVEGVTSDSAEPGETDFEVRGVFDAAALVRSLNAAGFHAKVSA